MKELKIKIVTGFRADQAFTIDMDEAHKAYFLFLNPNQRGIFKNGLAIIGADIRAIKPDYNATMGLNHDYTLTGEDMALIRRNGVDRHMTDAIVLAKRIAESANASSMIKLPLSEVKLLN